MMELVGIGKLHPNTLMMGFKYDWQTCEKVWNSLKCVYSGWDETNDIRKKLLSMFKYFVKHLCIIWVQ